MSTSKAGTDNDNGRAVDDAPLHAPEQLPDAPPVEGGASGSGGAGGGIDTPSDQVNDTPQPDSAILEDKAPPRESNPAQDDTLPGSEADRGPPTTGVDLSTIDDPATTAAAFASVGQLLVTQQIISAATAKYIFQGELNLARSDSAAAATAHPHCPGDVPPARFGVKQDPSSFIVGVPATSSDRPAERFMRDGYGVGFRRDSLGRRHPGPFGDGQPEIEHPPGSPATQVCGCHSYGARVSRPARQYKRET
ncbi:hypothetical protein PR003_g24928 [Phytophthora rubi]|uniref:Uncharacterized protein n=1 Tax=Phytophthora rubi TaxID=129364 RepID=A0A6A3L090_9STRA|nr:hypothetical protein PR001_g29113 [Phytophthora rubi]KAE9012992.1 hypothetical protein PR002_g14654 [Phytophthora rubi]KAE9291818.1 hypothetical protein PR003_g24928 [Phytophthora rubi]